MLLLILSFHFQFFIGLVISVWIIIFLFMIIFTMKYLNMI